MFFIMRLNVIELVIGWVLWVFLGEKNYKNILIMYI